MILRPWVTVTSLLLLLMVSTEAQEECPWIESMNSDCIKKTVCQLRGIGFYIWEDCALDSKLFDYNGTAAFSENCEYFSVKGKTISLKKLFNAETDNEPLKICSAIFLKAPVTQFYILDVNEFDPTPISQGLIFETHVKEGVEPLVIATVNYTDDDWKETEGLQVEMISADTKEFEMKNEYTNKMMVLSLQTTKPLDFEYRMFYKLLFNITSIDTRGNTRTVTQTILVSLEDVGDNPPYWMNYFPTFRFLEGDPGRDMFRVEARDRDVMINNLIKYKISEGNKENYFKINANSGQVATNKKIDRENLEAGGSTSLRISITAMECDAHGIPITPGSNITESTQDTVIYIDDVNDETPTFNEESFSIVMEELTSQDIYLDLIMFVFDMDEGDNGSYTLASRNPNLEVSPTDGMHNTSITLKALWKNGDTFFDFENHRNAALNFTIVAEEKNNHEHHKSAIVSITLLDVNDNSPKFNKPVYSNTLDEDVPTGTSIDTVSAKDDDISPNFNTESIRYLLKDCLALDINNITGEVTLARSLDFETKPAVTCTVEARDEHGSNTGNVGRSEFTIIVGDVVDEPPIFLGTPNMMVMENTPTTSTIGKITARDKDAGAHITFHIDWDHSEALKDNNLVDAKIDKWFTVDNDDSIPLENKYLGVLKVGQETPDREIVDTINLQIKAVDENTVVNNNSTTGHVKITIEDENDSPPEFVGSYEDQTVTENAGAGTKILTVRAKDPDLNDNVTISIEDETLVRLSQVTEENGIFSADLFVQSGSKIDREDIDSFDVVITITDLAEHTDSLKITINVIDLNDNPPVMVEGICGTTIDVTENESEGTYVTTVTATDADKEGAHKQIAYYLLNNQWQDEKSLVTPFSVDSSSGKVVVFLDKDRKVDREMYDTWTLVFRAHDGCEKDENNCTVLSTEDCHIYINVLDENDNGPENFSWSPEDDPLVVAESLRKDEEVRSNRFDKIYQFSAKDKDMPYTINSSITFEVHSFRAKNEEEELDWFVAESTNDTWAGDIHYYCTLRAKVNLTHQRGDYVMVLLAEDNGISPQKGNVTISMQVTDVNDNYPQFHFDTCVDGIPTVHMQENIYKSGDRVKCTTQNKTDNYLKFHVTDDDLGDNAKVSVDIDYDASTVEGADDKNGQKRSFKIDNTGENYTLMVLEQIDREKGSAYNLSVRAADNGQHSLQNSSVIRVIISNEFEFPPYFCLEGMCTQNISMVENEPDVTEKFKEAYDEDNKNLHPGDADYEEVYYEIIGGDINDFELTSNTETELKLKDKPKGLDREVTSQYSLTINVYNHKTPVDGTSKENNTLHVTIIVLDVNDNPPTFDDEVTFASFTASDGMGQTICTIQAQDLDENENFTYSLGNDFQWMETDITPTNPFRVVGDNNAANLILNFLPTGMNEGYCTFTVYVNDAVNHTGTTLAKVYAITNIFQLPVYFKNDPIEVKARQRHIEGVFKDVYGYPCIIDSIAQSQTDSGEKIDGQTTVLMHFINKETNSPVAVSVILDETDNDQVVRKLVNDLEDVDLNLMEIGARPIPEENNVQQLLILQVLLGVVSLVLGSLVFLLLTAYCLRTNSLERRVKVLSTNTFGSKSSELNRVGLEMTAIPGSNRFSGEGANPMYNMSEVDLKNDDSSSIGSGDSVLVGVEDNPEFKQNGIPNGYGNPTFSRSIDEVSVPAAFSGGTRTNPLLQLSGGGEDVDLADGLASFEVTIRRGSSGSEEESVNDNQLSNFTFGQ